MSWLLHLFYRLVFTISFKREKVEGKDMHMLKIHEEWIPTSYKNLQWSIKCSVLSNNIFSRYIAVTILRENASRQTYAAFGWLEGKKMKYILSYSSFTNIKYSTNCLIHIETATNGESTTYLLTYYLTILPNIVMKIY